MNSTRELLHQIADPSLSKDQRVRLRCKVAGQLEEADKFDAALEVLDEVWSDVGELPSLSGLESETAAEVLLRAGALTAYIGSAKQIKGSQEVAKDLLTESLSIFEKEHNKLGEAEVQTQMALCYWREGSFDYARAMVQEALIKLSNHEGDLKAVAMLAVQLLNGPQSDFTTPIAFSPMRKSYLTEAQMTYSKESFITLSLSSCAISEKLRIDTTT